MTDLREFFSHFLTKTIILLTFLLIEFALLILSLKSNTRTVTKAQYLGLIEDKCPSFCYTKRMRKPGTEEECCRVCLSEIEEGDKVRNLKCKHTFHMDCLDTWLQQYRATCPLCRNKVLPDEVVANFRQLQNQVVDDGKNISRRERILFLLHGGATLHRYL